MEDPASPGDPRVDYDVPHGKPWGVDMVLYLFMKAVSTGVMMVAAILLLMGDTSTLVTLVAPVTLGAPARVVPSSGIATYESAYESAGTCSSCSTATT